MIRFASRWPLFLLLLPVLFSCENRREAPPVPPISVPQAEIRPQAIFVEPVKPAHFELASGALTIWRRYASNRPALLLFASHPLLSPIDPALRADVGRIVATASDEELLRRGRATASDTLLVSPQTVSAALDAKIFSEIVVILPTREAADAVSLEKFATRVTEAGFLSPEEGKTLVLEGSTIRGSVRGIPLRVVHPDALPTIVSPSILHVDLGYFKETYINEIKTPIYDLIYEFAASVRDAGYKPVATTLSYSNQEVGYALTSRFVLRDLAQIMLHPEFLSGETPASWRLRAAAMYANIMFNETEARQLIQQAAQDTPGDAAALFDLGLLRFQQNRPDEGFALLDQVVAIDPGYAPAYIELADQGQRMGQWKRSFELLQKAADAMPDHAELRIRLAGDLIQRGRTAEARPLLAELAGLSWSAIYHPGIPETLIKMQAAASVDSLLPLPDDPEPSASPSPPPLRMPPSHMGSPTQRHP